MGTSAYDDSVYQTNDKEMAHMWETLLSNYWGLLATFVVGVLYMIVHRGVAMSQAKKTAMTLMLAAEKKAQQLALVTGQDKFNWVIDKGYDLLPAGLRMFISKPMFRTIVQDLFNGTVQVAKQYIQDIPKPALPPVPPIPPVMPLPAPIPRQGKDVQSAGDGVPV